MLHSPEKLYGLMVSQFLTSEKMLQLSSFRECGAFSQLLFQHFVRVVTGRGKRSLTSAAFSGDKEDTAWSNLVRCEVI